MYPIAWQVVDGSVSHLQPTVLVLQVLDLLVHLIHNLVVVRTEREGTGEGERSREWGGLDVLINLWQSVALPTMVQYTGQQNNTTRRNSEEASGRQFTSRSTCIHDITHAQLGTEVRSAGPSLSWHRIKLHLGTCVSYLRLGLSACLQLSDPLPHRLEWMK